MIAVGDRVRLPAGEGGHVGEVVRVTPMGPYRPPVLVLKTRFGVVGTSAPVELVPLSAAA